MVQQNDHKIAYSRRCIKFPNMISLPLSEVSYSGLTVKDKVLLRISLVYFHISGGNIFFLSCEGRTKRS